MASLFRPRGYSFGYSFAFIASPLHPAPLPATSSRRLWKSRTPSPAGHPAPEREWERKRKREREQAGSQSVTPSARVRQQTQNRQQQQQRQAFSRHTPLVSECEFEHTPPVALARYRLYNTSRPMAHHRSHQPVAAIDDQVLPGDEPVGEQEDGRGRDLELRAGAA